jgi:hypothetical protein
MRHPIALTASGLLLALSFATVQAQGAASAPGPGMGMGGMHGWKMNRDNTPGWSMMSRAERRQHHDKMMAMTDPAACSAYMEEHHAKMAERAKERGRALPAKPRSDACAALQKR